jgi:hypothetical protein
MIPIRTLSLLVYFTYILIDIIIYALGSKPWSSGIFRMVGRVIVDPSLGISSPCEVVPLVLVLVRPIIILSDSKASHDFMSYVCAKKAKLSLVATKVSYVISILRGRVDVN